jgi:hypothetical protein
MKKYFIIFSFLLLFACAFAENSFTLENGTKIRFSEEEFFVNEEIITVVDTNIILDSALKEMVYAKIEENYELLPSNYKQNKEKYAKEYLKNYDLSFKVTEIKPTLNEQLNQLPENVNVNEIYIFTENKSLMIQVRISYSINILSLNFEPEGIVLFNLNEKEISKIELPWYLSFLEGKVESEINKRLNL